MEATWNFMTENLWPHAPGIVGFFSFYIIGKFMTAQVWTKKRATTPGKGQKFFHFMRRTLSMHAPVMGVIMGCIPGMIASPGVEWFWGTVIYWGGLGMASSFGFHAFSKYVKGKTDGKVDLEKTIDEAVRGPSMIPSTPPKGTKTFK